MWQEQVSRAVAGPSVHTFVKATQPVLPPGRPSSGSSKESPGCSHLSFDASSSLLATQIDDSPSTVWIWDVRSRELRSVLVFHVEVTTISWHPSARETLLLRCGDSDYRGLVFVWDPLSLGPISVDFRRSDLASETTRRPTCAWLRTEDQAPAVFYSDGIECLLAAPMEGDAPPWAETRHEAAAGVSLGNESPLFLVPAVEGPEGIAVCKEGQMHDGSDKGSDSESEMQDDTFHYKLEGKSRLLDVSHSGDTDQPPGHDAGR